MVDYASNCFSQITIFTNASLLNEETVRLLKNKNVSIEISLYGYNERTYDQYVGVNGMFPKFEKGLSLLKQSCVHYLLKTSITKSNVKIVDELEKYAEQWCVDYKYDPTTLIRMTPGEKQDSYDERLSPYSTARLLMMHQGISEEVKRLYNQDKKCNELYDCNGGESTCLISCDLHMSYCVAVRNPYYDLNISGRSLQEGLIWLQNQKKAFLTKDDKCYDCRLRSICRYCPGRFEVETGNARVPPEWNCEFGNILLNLAINND